MRAHRQVVALAALLLALIAIKLAAILLDPQLRLFLGDSSSFLLAARSDWLPPDRSVVYPLMIRWLVEPFGTLAALLYGQAMAGVVIAVLLAWVLRVPMALPRILVGVLVCAFALEPAQLFYERMVLAETFGLLAFVGFFAAGLAYLAHPRALWLPVIVLLGLAAVALRMNYLPVVLVISLGLPLLRSLDPVQRPMASSVALHCLLAAACVIAAHGAFKHEVGRRLNTAPGYIGHGGFMRMGLIAPLIKPEHFERVGLPGDFAEGLRFDLGDPRARPQHLWNRGGLADAIKAAGLDVELVCRKLANYAVRDDPFGVLRLGLGTLAGYFNPDRRRMRLAKDLARQGDYPDKVIADARTHWHYDFDGVAQRWTAVSRAFAAGSRWLVGCLFLLLPLALANVIVHWRDPRRLPCVLAALFGIGLVATHVLFSNIASYRYLHALPFFVLINALPLAVSLWQRRSRRSLLPA